MTTIKISLTREQLEKDRARLAEQGIEIQGDEGSIERQKVGMTFKYDEDAEELTIVVEHKPFFYPSLESQIRQWFSNAE